MEGPLQSGEGARRIEKKGRRMNILVSACLLGVKCRYDGRDNYCDVLDRLKERHHLIPICPESYGGLPIPREPSEIRGGRVISRSGEDVTSQFRRGAEALMRLAEYFDCDLAVLKERSPSCGSDRIYDGSFSKKLTDGDGIFAGMVKSKNIPVIGESEISSYFDEDGNLIEKREE